MYTDIKCMYIYINPFYFTFYLLHVAMIILNIIIKQISPDCFYFSNVATGGI